MKILISLLIAFLSFTAGAQPEIRIDKNSLMKGKNVSIMTTYVVLMRPFGKQDTGLVSEHYFNSEGLLTMKKFFYRTVVDSVIYTYNEKHMLIDSSGTFLFDNYPHFRESLHGTVTTTEVWESGRLKKREKTGPENYNRETVEYFYDSLGRIDSYEEFSVYLDMSCYKTHCTYFSYNEQGLLSEARFYSGCPRYSEIPRGLSDSSLTEYKTTDPLYFYFYTYEFNE